MQKQLNKQAIEQKIDLEYNIDFLGRAISKAEMYALRFGDQNKAKNIIPRFGYYNRFNNNTEKERMALFKSFVNSVKFVDYGFEETEDKFNEIIFPANMTKEDIMKYVIDLSTLVRSPQEKAVYDDLVKAILRAKKNDDNYKDLYKREGKKNQNSYWQNDAGWGNKYEKGFEFDNNSYGGQNYNQYDQYDQYHQFGNNNKKNNYIQGKFK